MFLWYYLHTEDYEFDEKLVNAVVAFKFIISEVHGKILKDSHKKWGEYLVSL